MNELMFCGFLLELVRRLGLKGYRQRRGTVMPRYRVILTAPLVLLLLGVGLTACESRSFERVRDGSTVYLDELSEAQKADARQKIVASLTRGITAYEIGVGDEIEILFHIDRTPTADKYRIAVGDKLRIEYLSETENVRTVQVPPDGRISLPLIEPMMAAGQTPDTLSRQLQARYNEVLTGARITVTVTETHSPLDDFIDTLGASGSSGKARSIVDKVLPDGTILVPRLPPLQARGLTLRDLENQIDRKYASLGINVFVSLVPRTLRVGAMLVIGEVAKPGRYELERPQTVLMAVAQAGGVLPSGSMREVRLFYIAGDGMPRVRLINLNDVMDALKLEDDMIVPDNSVIYVPPTELAKAGRLMDSVVHDILRFQGFSIGGGLQLNSSTSGGGGTTFITTTPSR